MLDWKFTGMSCGPVHRAEKHGSPDRDDHMHWSTRAPEPITCMEAPFDCARLPLAVENFLSKQTSDQINAMRRHNALIRV